VAVSKPTNQEFSLSNSLLATQIFESLNQHLGVVSLSTQALFRALSYCSKIFKCIQSLTRRSNAKATFRQISALPHQS